MLPEGLVSEGFVSEGFGGRANVLDALFGGRVAEAVAALGPPPGVRAGQVLLPRCRAGEALAGVQRS